MNPNNFKNHLELRGIELFSKEKNQIFLETVNDISINSINLVKGLTLENLSLKNLINTRE